MKSSLIRFPRNSDFSLNRLPRKSLFRAASQCLMIGLTAIVGIIAVPFSAKADVTATGTETASGDVVFDFSGTVDLTGLNFLTSSSATGAFITPGNGRFTSLNGAFDAYRDPTNFSFNFGGGGSSPTVTTSGSTFDLNTPFNQIRVPAGYTSNDPLAGSFTFTGTDFTGLNLDVTGAPHSVAVTPNFTFTLLLVPFVPSSQNPATGGENPATGGENRGIPQTVLAVNTGAIVSAQTTGLNSISTTLSNVQNAAQNATRDLNNRLFRARSGKNTGGPAVVSTLDGTSRYLNFAQNQNIDYRVALGLADGEEVELVDTLSAGGGHPFAMVGVPAVSGSATIAVEGGSGKNSVTDKVVIEDAPRSKFEVFSQFDYGFYDQDNLTKAFRGFETDNYAGSIGGEMRVNDWLVAGAAYTYLNSDTQSTANLGSSDLEGNLLTGYFTAFHGNTHLDFLYSYGDFDNDITRNTLLGRTAYGETESHSHNFDLNLGHTIEVNERFSFGPSAGLNYTTGEVDGYTERNGGLANLVYPDHDFESMIGRLGGYATFTTDTAAGLLTTQVSAGWAHEFQPENGNVTASLETSPFALVTANSARSIGGFKASEERAHAGTDWLELGATTRLDLNNTGFHLKLGYQGQFFRNNASGHFGSAKVGYEW